MLGYLAVMFAALAIGFSAMQYVRLGSTEAEIRRASEGTDRRIREMNEAIEGIRRTANATAESVGKVLDDISEENAAEERSKNEMNEGFQNIMSYSQDTARKAGRG